MKTLLLAAALLITSRVSGEITAIKGSGGTPGGTNGQLQYKSGGQFHGVAGSTVTGQDLALTGNLTVGSMLRSNPIPSTPLTICATNGDGGCDSGPQFGGSGSPGGDLYLRAGGASRHNVGGKLIIHAGDAFDDNATAGDVEIHAGGVGTATTPDTVNLGWIKMYTNQGYFDWAGSVDHYRMAISSWGYVAIGPDFYPTEKLDVDGNVKATAFIGDGSQLTGVTAAPFYTVFSSFTVHDAISAERYDIDGGQFLYLDSGDIIMGLDPTKVDTFTAAGDLQIHRNFDTGGGLIRFKPNEVDSHKAEIRKSNSGILFIRNDVGSITIDDEDGIFMAPNEDLAAGGGRGPNVSTFTQTGDLLVARTVYASGIKLGREIPVMSKTQFDTEIPLAAGDVYICSDCTIPYDVCVATGTGVSDFRATLNSAIHTTVPGTLVPHGCGSGN